MKTKNHSIWLILSICLSVASCPLLLAQDSLWSKTFGGTNIDVAYSVKETSDDGYIIAGYTRSFGTISGRNLWLFRTDKSGNLLWNKTFGGNSDDEAAAVKQTSDGGFIAVGYTSSFGAGAKDVYVVRTDSAGNELWSKTFGGASDEEAYALDVMPDGGCVVGCATSSSGAGSRDGWLIRLNSQGNTIWTKTLGGLSTDGIRGVQRTSDNGFIITGWTASDGSGVLGNAWLVKTDSLGNIIFNKNFGGSDADRGLSVQQTADGGYILTGYTASSGAGLDDLFLVRTDGAGNQVWAKTFGGTGRDYGNAVIQMADGNFMVAGYTLSFGAGSDDLWLLKIDITGNMLWQKTFGGTASDVAYSMDLTSDGGYVIAGHTLSSGAGLHDAWLLRKIVEVVPVELVSFSAKLQGENIQLEWQTASETNNRGWEIQQLEGNEFIPIGFVEGAGNSTDQRKYYFLHKATLSKPNYYRLKQLDFDGSFSFSSVIESNGASLSEHIVLSNYPNPFNPGTTISYRIVSSGFLTITVFDVMGSKIYESSRYVDAGLKTEYIDFSGKAAGQYVVRVTLRRNNELISATSRKIVLLK